MNDLYDPRKRWQDDHEGIEHDPPIWKVILLLAAIAAVLALFLRGEL